MYGKGTFGKTFNALLDLLYPPGIYCVCCEKITDGRRTYGMCNECLESVKWAVGRCCIKCGKPLNENNPRRVCFDCSSGAHSFDKGYICSEYGVHEKNLIYNLKYSSRGYIADIMGEIAFDKMASELGKDGLTGAYDIVVPVPIFRERQQKRGFNQAELIAGSFAKRAGLRMEGDLIIRTRATAAMKGLNAAERAANISGAFEIRPRKLHLIRRARILLVDDIYTTGSTVDEIAMLLKNPLKEEIGSGDAGASCVDFLAFSGASDRLVQYPAASE